MKFLKKNIEELGEGHIVQYILFKWKLFVGIWFYNWKTIDQNRFHTHAFNSYAMTLNGGYRQEVIKDGKIIVEDVSKLFKFRHLPVNYCHRILEAKPNTWTMVIFGSWSPNWWEYFPKSKTWVKYSWGRKVVKKINGNEKTNLNG